MDGDYRPPNTPAGNDRIGLMGDVLPIPASFSGPAEVPFFLAVPYETEDEPTE
jgi:hypothetical protein